jgi:hypothetical protein
LSLPSGLPTKILYAPLLSCIHTTCPTHLMILDLITRTIFGEECGSLSCSLCSLLHFLVTLSLLGPNIFLSTKFSNSFSLFHDVYANKCTTLKRQMFINIRPSWFLTFAVFWMSYAFFWVILRRL